MTSHPHRIEILISPLAAADGGWSVQKSLDDGLSWQPTDIGPYRQIDQDPVTPDLQALISEFETQRPEEIRTSLFLERQTRLGWFLTKSLFGEDGPSLDKKWIHIIPSRAPGTDALDFGEFLDFALRVPWPLMTRTREPGATALPRSVLNPVAITVDGGFDLPAGREWFDDIRVTPCPNILLIMPSGETSDEPTFADDHFSEIFDLLSPRYQEVGQSGARPGIIRRVKTMAELEKALGSQPQHRFSPQIVYYYGHATSEGKDTILFLDDDSHSLNKLAALLQAQMERTQSPPVVWLNACRSGAARLNSAVRLLSPHAATVIATRTAAVVEDARELGKAVLPMLALEGWSPVSAMRTAMAEQKAETIESARWATSIVAVQYKYWSTLGTEQFGDLDEESYGDIPLRLDRRAQVSAIKAFIEAGIQQRARRPEIVFWRGELAQGPDLFENRFRDLVREQFAEWSPIVRRVELGLDNRLAREREGSADEFCLRLHDALVDTRLADRSALGRTKKPNQLKDLFRRILGGEKSILVLSHGPFEDIRRPLIRNYLEFWQTLYAYLDSVIDPDRHRIVVGLGVAGSDTAPFDLAGAELSNIELAKVAPADIEQHVRDFEGAYGFDAARKTQNIGETYGHRFRPIYDQLRALLGLAEP